MANTKINRSGFTIIEVVITIAIGAAVMALVLNAVAGARRSQRNNARSSDVNQIAAGINQYIATRNSLPGERSQLTTLLENGDKFGHYELDSINPALAWDGTAPATAGDFVDAGGFSSATASSGTGSVGEAVAAAADRIVVLTRAGCEAGQTGDVVAGGIREMAIVYRLEGQDAPICIEI